MGKLYNARRREEKRTSRKKGKGVSGGTPQERKKKSSSDAYGREENGTVKPWGGGVGAARIRKEKK